MREVDGKGGGRTWSCVLARRWEVLHPSLPRGLYGYGVSRWEGGGGRGKDVRNVGVASILYGGQ